MKSDRYSEKQFFWIYLFLLGLMSMFLARFASSTYGAGVGTDGAIQMATADHLQAGKGFFDYTEEPFIRWPPLYPLTLAALSFLTGLDTFTIGWTLNVLFLGMSVWLGGALLYYSFENEILWAFIGSLVMVTSVSMLSLYTHIGTDPMFIVLSLAYILVASHYLKTKARGSLLTLALTACLASLQRLPGIILIAMTFLLIVFANRENIVKCIQEGLIFSAVPLLPLTFWVVVHNFIQNKTLFGVAVFNATLPLINLQNSLGKILHWFLPYSLTARISSLLLIGLPLLTVFAINRRGDWLRLGRRLAHPPVLVSLVFASLYFLFLVFTINSVDTSYTFYDRYQIVILAPVLILIFTALQQIIIARIRRGGILIRLLVLGAFAAWLPYPVSSLNSFISISRIEGVIPYNLYNTRAMHESRIVRRLNQLSSDRSRDIYSNYPAAVWFYTRRSVFESPRGTILEELNVEQMVQDYRGWPGSRPGYLVWFLPNEYDHVLEPRDLNRLAQLNLIYKGRDGELYHVRSRSR